MRICLPHWQVCRDAVSEAGLDGLVSSDGGEVVERVSREFRGEEDAKDFDPLMAMNSHWWSVALEHGGLAMMGEAPDGSNEGHFCPLCELASHYKDFDPKTEVNSVASQMATYARSENLIPRLS